MYIDKENFVAWMERIMDRLDMQDKKIDRLLSGHNYLNGEKLLDNQDLCFMLKVSTKTLQRYRKKGILPYLTLDGKYFYRNIVIIYNIFVRRISHYENWHFSKETGFSAQCLCYALS